MSLLARSQPITASARLAVVALVVAAMAIAGGCGDSGDGAPEGVRDPAAAGVAAEEVPPWFPAGFRPPPGSVIVDVIEDPEAGFGRTVSWRSDDSFGEVVTHVENSLRSLGWTPTEVATEEGVSGAERTTFFIENDAVFSIRVFEDEALEGVRLAVELPEGR